MEMQSLVSCCSFRILGPSYLDAGPATMELFSGNAEADSRPMERGTWPMDRS